MPSSRKNAGKKSRSISPPINGDSADSARDQTQDVTAATTNGEGNGHAGHLGEEQGAAENNVQRGVSVALRLPNKSTLRLMIPPSESIGNIHATVLEQPRMLQYSCSRLYRQGSKLDPAVDISSLADSDSSKEVHLQLREAQYSERDVRVHILRMREILLAQSTRANASQAIVDPAASVWRKLTTEKYLNFGFRDDLKPNKPSEQQGAEEADDKVIETVYDLGDVTAELADFPRADVLKGKKIRRAVTSLSVSIWNPAPAWRCLRGDLLYLAVVFEGQSETHHITATADGFYFNSSTNTEFSSTRRSGVFHSLSALLTSASSAFANSYNRLLDLAQLAHSNALESAAIPIAMPAWNWLVDVPDVQNAEHVADGLRGLGSIAGGDSVLETSNMETLRDWNEDLQALRHAAVSAVGSPLSTSADAEGMTMDALNRARQYGLVHTQFVNAALAGAQAILSGSVLPITGAAESDNPDDQLYIWQNILFSLPESYVPKFTSEKHAEPREAARIAAAKDLEGIRRVNAAQVADVTTMPTVIIDLHGKRLVAQGIIPGIVGNPNGAKVAYGSYEDLEVPAEEAAEQKEVRWDADIHNAMERIGRRLHWTEHSVADDKTGERYNFWSSVEVKGIRGFDGRQYLFDLARTAPIDIAFLDSIDAPAQQPLLPPYPHRLTFLRHELVQIFHEAQVQKHVAARYKEERERINHAKPKAAVEESAEAEGEPAKEESEEPIDITPFVSEVTTHFNCDAFGAWDSMDAAVRDGKAPEPGVKVQQENHVRVLAQFQLDVIIPEFIEAIATSISIPLTGAALVDSLHRRGINLRHLGAVVAATDKVVADQEQTQSARFRLGAFRSLCLREMVVRALKHISRRLYVLTRDIPALLSHLLNAFLSLDRTTCKVEPAANDPSSLSDVTPQVLCELLSFEVAKRFRFVLPADHFSSPLYTEHKTAFLREACQRLGVQLRLRSYSLALTAKPSMIITADDIVNVVPIVKSAPFRSALAESQYELADSQARSGQIGAASVTLEHALAMHEQAYATPHPETLRVQLALAELYMHLFVQSDNEQCRDRALDLQRQAVIGLERTTGLDSQETIHAYLQLASLESVADRPRLSLRYARHATMLQEIGYGSNHPECLSQMTLVARLHRLLERWDMSGKYWEKVKDFYETHLESNQNAPASVYQSLAVCAFNTGDRKRATALQKTAYNTVLEKYGKDDPRTKEMSDMLSRMVQTAVVMAQQETMQRQQPAIVREASVIEQGLSHMANARPVDELVAYINGTSDKKKGKKANKKR
ncbi:Intracellular distribution of mitochondria [Sorochytrium milnesiophthora]